LRGIPRRKLIFGHKPNAPRPARTGGPFHFFGIFVIFLKKIGPQRHCASRDGRQGAAGRAFCDIGRREPFQPFESIA
jgi:hypothetical protein